MKFSREVRSLLVAAVVPFVAATALRSDLGWGFALAWRGAGLVPVVYLTRNAVLRLSASFRLGSR